MPAEARAHPFVSDPMACPADSGAVVAVDRGVAQVLDLHWAIGHQVVSGPYLREVCRRGERIHLKTVGKLTVLPNATAADILETVDGFWLFGLLDAPPEVRKALKSRRRWKPPQAARRNKTARVVHHEITRDGVTTDRSVGRVWFDRYELEKRLESGQKLDISVDGILSFASDVSAELVSLLFQRIRVRGLVLGAPPVRAAVRRLGRGS